MTRRPSKCRVCGHRFASGEDICPECFTAREDDISCDNLEKSEHSHGRDYSTTESSDVFSEFETESFVDEQREDEAKDPIPSSTYGGKMGPAPQTYAGSTYTSQPYTSPTNFDYSAYEPRNTSGGSRAEKLDALKNSGGSFIDEQRQAEAQDPIPDRTYESGPSGGFGGFTAAGRRMYSGQQGSASRAEKLEALRNGTYHSNFGSSAGGSYYGARNGMNVYPAAFGQQKKAGSKFAAVIIIIMVMAFFIPLVVMIATFSSMPSSTNSKTERGHIDPVSVDLPDFSMPDVDIPDIYSASFTSEKAEYELYADDIWMGKEFTYAQAKKWFSQSELPFFIGLNGEPADDTRLRLVEMHLSISYDADYTPGKYSATYYQITLDGYKSMVGDKITSARATDLICDPNKGVLCFIVPAEATYFELDVPVYFNGVKIDSGTESVAEDELLETASLQINNFCIEKDDEIYDREGIITDDDANS